MTGFDIHISAGGYEATVSTFGAALRSLRLSGREFLDSFEKPEENPVARGQILVPFPNRVEDGRYSFGGEELHLPLDEPEEGHAIHGLARRKGWRVSDRSESSVALRYELLPSRGYPFSLDLRIWYELSPSGLFVGMAATNTGGGPLPFGAGYHPYFTVDTEFADEAVLRVPAESRLELDERLIPRGRASVEGGGLDFREERVIGEAKINACFTDLSFDGDGRTRTTLSHPHGRPKVEVWADGEHPYFQIYTGDDIPEESERRRSVAIEPMTCAPNAFNSGDGLRVLRPEESFVGEWGITITP
ncbi:MAG: aldose 1-epimerase family protein [Rubrobacter sp.]|nr:aldose 1-epimerase family protein [Rubrobacter sp.]